MQQILIRNASRVFFSEGFKRICAQLNRLDPSDTPLEDAQHQQSRIFIHNALSLFAFADLNPYEFISVPQRINGEWQLVDYKVVPIELTPTSGIEKLFIWEADRVFAHGLEPIACDQAEPHLFLQELHYR